MKFLSKNRHWIVFSLFLCIHAAAVVMTDYFGDDYYYATFVRDGFSHFLSENVLHYNTVNGRALVHLLDEVLIGWGLWPFRIFSVLFYGGLVILVAGLAARTYRPRGGRDPDAFRRALCLSCAAFGLLDISMLREGVLWATGSLNYFFPIGLCILLFYLCMRRYETGKGGVWLPILSFFAACTTEQSAVSSALVILCFLVTYAIFRKKVPPVPYFLSAVTAGIALWTLFSAPGNAVRQTFYPEFYAKPVTERVLDNLFPLLRENGSVLPIVSIWLFLAAFRAVRDLPGTRGVRRAYGVILPALSLLSIGAVIRIWIFDAEIDLISAAILAVTGAAVLCDRLIRYFTKHDVAGLFFSWCAVGMQAAMLLSPLYGQRTVLVSAVLLLTLVVRDLVEFDHPIPCLGAALLAAVFYRAPILSAAARVLLPLGAALAVLLGWLLFARKSRTAVCTALFCAVSLSLFSTVPLGYAKNLSVHISNRAAVAAYRESEQTEPLVLYKLKYDRYGYAMPDGMLYDQRNYLRFSGLDPDTPVTYITD